jgi:hypothetical protein
MRKIEDIEFQFRGLEPLIVAPDAVAIDQRPAWISGLLGRHGKAACDQCGEE